MQIHQMNQDERQLFQAKEAEQGDARSKLAKDLNARLARVKRAQGSLPAGLRKLAEQLHEEALEDLFDNMPV